jgi:hypothetical protein
MSEYQGEMIRMLKEDNVKLRKALDGAWRQAIGYPWPQVCKHLVACHILSDMEEIGFVVPSELAKAVVRADDETALAWPPLEMKPF